MEVNPRPTFFVKKRKNSRGTAVTDISSWSQSRISTPLCYRCRIYLRADRRSCCESCLTFGFF